MKMVKTVGLLVEESNQNFIGLKVSVCAIIAVHYRTD